MGSVFIFGKNTSPYLAFSWNSQTCVAQAGVCVFRAQLLLRTFYLRGHWTKEEIEESQNKYYQDTKADQLRVESELQQQAVLLFQAKKIKEQISQSRQTLRQIYEYNVIAPKYHEYTAVCSLYEYLSLGLCSELKGPYGAYNILEDYKRLDKIILGIYRIVHQLEQIKSNQYRIYHLYNKPTTSLRHWSPLQSESLIPLANYSLPLISKAKKHKNN